MSKRISVLKSDLTVEELARQIVLDGFNIQRKNPEMLVPSKLPIPVGRLCRKRIAKRNNVHPDNQFHSLFDKAIHLIEKEGHG